MKIQPKTEKKIKNAKIQLLLQHPFIGDILFQLKELIKTTQHDIIATDGKRLYINEEGFKKLTPEQRKTALAHEALHVAFMHHLRMEGKDPEIWNMATDMAINPLLYKAGFAKIPNSLIDDQSPPRNAEAIYNELIKRKQSNNKEQKESQEQGKNKKQEENKHKKECNCMKKPKPKDNGPFSNERNTKENLERAKANSTGNITKEIEDMIFQTEDTPKQKWHEILKQFMRDTIGNTHIATNKFNRFLLEEEEIYIPAMKGKQLEKITFAIDASGSISNSEYKEFMSQIKGIAEDIGFPNTQVLIGDTKITYRKEFDTGEEIEPPRRNCHGGTEFQPFFEEVSQNPPQVLIFLTDMMPTDWDNVLKNPPNYPVYWISTTKKTAPFGITIPIKDST